MIYLPRGLPVREKINPARINLPEAMEKLRVGAFSGYLRFDAQEGCGVIIFKKGMLISALFRSAEETDPLIAFDAIARMFEVSILGNAVLNIFKFSPELAVEIHAMLHGRYLLQGQVLQQVDVRALLEKIDREQINGCVRIYAENRAVLIFYDHGKALGFFHDGGTEIDTEADLNKSVARLPEARIDLLECQSSQDLALADLMGSADLRPIWQRARKILLEDRRIRETEEIRTRQEVREQRRQRTLTSLKTIAGAHVGKFGVSHVEKAFAQVSSDLTSQELELFFAELQRLSELVAGPKKIVAMIEEMKRHLSSGN